MFEDGFLGWTELWSNLLKEQGKWDKTISMEMLACSNVYRDYIIQNEHIWFNDVYH